MGFCCIRHQAGVGEDQRVQAEFGCAVDGLNPAWPVARLRVSVQGQQYLLAARMGVGDAVAHLRRIEVESGEVARVGGVLEAEIDTVGTVVDGSLEGRQAAGGADELDLGSVHEVRSLGKKSSATIVPLPQGRFDPCQSPCIGCAADAARGCVQRAVWWVAAAA